MWTQRWTQVILAALFIALVVEILIIAPKKLDQVSIRESDESDILPEPALPDVEQIATGFDLVQTQEGNREWQVKGAKGYFINSQGGRWKVEKVTVIFYGEKGTYFNVTGDQGEVDIKTKDMRIFGKVRTVSSNGYKFNTEEVSYLSQSRELRAPGRVEMLGPGTNNEKLWLTGKGMLAEVRNSRIIVQSEVKAEKTIRDGKVLNIKSEKAEFSGRSNYARFYQQVVMDVDTLRITGPEALFRYDPQSNLLRAVEIDGGVRVSDVDKLATSDKLSVDFKDDKFIFRGRPRLVQNQDELFGEQIIFLNGGKRVKVLGAKARVDRGRLENSN